MIKKLSPDLINKIAAGEVVERPASVVKELVENAIDANATVITVELEKGGMELIRVKDNGEGIDQSELSAAIEQHATSKLSTVEDLFEITSMGFRGEALASIAAVSQFTLASKKPLSETAYLLCPNESSEISPEPWATQSGTAVTVKNLFFNVPARQKFLKSEQTELRHIIRYLNLAGMMYPNIEFELIHKKKRVFRYGVAKQEDRFRDILGNTFIENTLPLESATPSVGLGGRIAMPTFVHATHSNQYLFVNKRPVYDHMVSRKILESYRTLIPRGYFPAFLLSIEVDPKMVDVNVHPRKSEVKFGDPSSLYSFLSRSIGGCLSQQRLKYPGSEILGKENIIFSSRQQYPTQNSFQKTSTHTEQGLGATTIRKEKYLRQESLDIEDRAGFTGGIHRSATLLEKNEWKVLGQIKKSFILVETNSGLAILDQHAVSEIVNYQKLMNEKNQKLITSQHLLVPVQIEANTEDKILIDQHRPLLLSLGWEAEEFSERSVAVHAVPKILKDENISIIFKEVLDKLREDRGHEESEKGKSLILFAACRGAITFGDELSHTEMEALLESWLATENREACEHGRPSIKYLEEKEMMKWFKR